jgi:rSAM/selenodomain-associated transferase 1
VVLAKAPVLGRSKTRLCPPCTPAQAARLAEAALVDTLAAVAAARVARRIIVLDGQPGPWLPRGFQVVGQRPGRLGDRLAGAFADVAGPALFVGMDTPQITPALLEQSAAALNAQGIDAVLGPADDGGYWTIGLRRADPEVFRDVPMSDPSTYAAQRRRLRELGLRVAELRAVRDVDTWSDARAVAAAHPRTRFARALEAMAVEEAPATAQSR